MVCYMLDFPEILQGHIGMVRNRCRADVCRTLLQLAGRRRRVTTGVSCRCSAASQADPILEHP
jgi:hypothetical protein